MHQQEYRVQGRCLIYCSPLSQFLAFTCRCLDTCAPTLEDKLACFRKVAQEHGVEWGLAAAAPEILPAPRTLLTGTSNIQPRSPRPKRSIPPPTRSGGGYGGSAGGFGGGDGCDGTITGTGYPPCPPAHSSTPANLQSHASVPVCLSVRIWWHRSSTHLRQYAFWRSCLHRAMLPSMRLGRFESQIQSAAKDLHLLVSLTNDFWYH